jgi:hypothetical protein
MEIMLLTLILCLFLAIPIQIHVGSMYWVTYLVLVYFITFPSGPVQQIIKRIKERKEAEKVECQRCQNTINEMDVICSACKLEMSYGSHSTGK